MGRPSNAAMAFASVAPDTNPAGNAIEANATPPIVAMSRVSAIGRRSERADSDIAPHAGSHDGVKLTCRGAHLAPAPYPFGLRKAVFPHPDAIECSIGADAQGSFGSSMLQGCGHYSSARYIGLLFVVASYGDRKRRFGRADEWHGLIYPLSLAIYCPAGRIWARSTGFAHRILRIFTSIWPMIMATLFAADHGIVRLAKDQTSHRSPTSSRPVTARRSRCCDRTLISISAQFRHRAAVKACRPRSARS